MLVLYETALGFCLFKVTDAGKLQNPSSLWKEFQTPEKANGLYAFSRPMVQYCTGMLNTTFQVETTSPASFFIDCRSCRRAHCCSRRQTTEGVEGILEPGSDRKGKGKGNTGCC
jgi:hypothetical protein